MDSAIGNRREHGETTLAELDADAYSRGMGGSTYLSGMKRREYDAVAADIAMLEANYNAQLAKYLYEHETITGEEFMKILQEPAQIIADEENK